jgi:HPt (histidine-containing phosphotransfer) domain-containing protein
MSNNQNDIEAKLQKLRDAYAGQLPAKLDTVTTHWQSLCDDWHWETADLLHHAIHSLAGSGGSFGFSQLGKQAREIEIELKGWIKEQQIPDHDQQQGIGQKIAALQEAAGDPGP